MADSREGSPTKAAFPAVCFFIMSAFQRHSSPPQTCALYFMHRIGITSRVFSIKNGFLYKICIKLATYLEKSCIDADKKKAYTLLAKRVKGTLL